MDPQRLYREHCPLEEIDVTIGLESVLLCNIYVDTSLSVSLKSSCNYKQM